MMTEDEALTKLDTLLTLLQSQEKSLGFNELLRLIKEKDSSFDAKLLKIGLEKLEEDNYAYEFVDEIDKMLKYYSISIIGIIFHGYVDRKKIDTEAKFIADQNEKRIVRNETWLLRGTWFAGIAAALLLLWQVWIWFYPVHKDYPYWIWETIPKKP